MKPTIIAPIPWSALRADYARRGAPSLKAFAEQYDVPYKALCQRAKREGWRRLRDLELGRQRVRTSEAELAFARKVAAAAGRYLPRLAGAVALPLEKLAVDAWQAHFAVSSLWTAALHLAEAKYELAELQAGERDPFAAWEKARRRIGDTIHGPPGSEWPRFDFFAYREGGPASLPKRVRPARLALPGRVA